MGGFTAIVHLCSLLIKKHTRLFHSLFFCLFSSVIVRDVADTRKEYIFTKE